MAISNLRSEISNSETPMKRRAPLITALAITLVVVAAYVGWKVLNRQRTLDTRIAERHLADASSSALALRPVGGGPGPGLGGGRRHRLRQPHRGGRACLPLYAQPGEGGADRVRRADGPHRL